ncbi:hypothetical protein [Maribellus mangrovi]|uniref:hypothetical protein n=1 Tax=Maribellus mangrovi TaxID=3133146 RepID=UPI0030EE6DD0
MKKMYLLLLVMTTIITAGFSQEKPEEFKPNGKPLALIFTNFNTSFSDGESTKSFEITRAYLGYEYNFSKEWYAKLVLDVGDPKVGGLQMTAYLKNAYIQYKKSNFKASFGMISTTQFKVSEKTWGLRYIEKSYQDAYKFNASADIGFNLDYKFADFVSADFSLINGEGYKLIQADEFVRPGLGVTVKPVDNVVGRVYVDTYGKDVKQQSLATFLAYSGEKLTVGGEYNYQKNHNRVEGQDIYGTSFYATYQAADKFKLFGRFDDLKSKALEGESDPWQLNKDGQLLMAGLEFNAVKGVKFAPNVRYWNPADESIPATTYAYLNLELKF